MLGMKLSLQNLFFAVVQGVETRALYILGKYILSHAPSPSLRDSR